VGGPDTVRPPAPESERPVPTICVSYQARRLVVRSYEGAAGAYLGTLVIHPHHLLSMAQAYQFPRKRVNGF